MGYVRPGDLLTAYPSFFDNSVAPYIGVGVSYLEQTDEGREILGHLYANLAIARAGQQADLRAVANS